MSESLARSLASPIGGTGLDAATATVAPGRRAGVAPGTLTSAAPHRLLPGPHRAAQPPAARGHRGQPGGAGRGRGQRRPARAGRHARPAGRHPGPAQGQPRGHRAAGHGRARPRWPGAEPATPSCLSRLRAAGAVILGKANLSEWANFRSTQFSSSGWSTLGGQAATRTALAATRRAPVPARPWPWPPAWPRSRSAPRPTAPSSARRACGVVGIKPTLGLVSRTGIVPISAAQDTAGPDGPHRRRRGRPAHRAGRGRPRRPGHRGRGRRARRLHRFLDPGALDGARLGVWRDSAESVGPGHRWPCWTPRSPVLRASGRDGHRPGRAARRGQTWRGPSSPRWLHEFKHDLNATWPRCPASTRPARWPSSSRSTSARRRGAGPLRPGHCSSTAQATSGDLADADCLDARGEARRGPGTALDAAAGQHAAGRDGQPDRQPGLADRPRPGRP